MIDTWLVQKTEPNKTARKILGEKFKIPEFEDEAKAKAEFVKHKAEIAKVINTLNAIKNGLGNIPFSEAALTKIINNLDYFVYGVAADNLPAGFFLDKNPQSYKGSLRFDIKLFASAREKPSDGYSQPPLLIDDIAGARTEDITPLAQERFEEILNRLSTNANLHGLEKNILETLEFTAENLKALTPILHDKLNGEIKLYALLNTLKQLKNEDPRLYKSIKKCFIDKSKNLLELANIDTLKIVKESGRFSPAQKEWWCHLTEQHTGEQGVGKGDLADLYHTFNAFYKDLNEFWHKVYEKSDFEPPYQCSLGSIGNMQVTLNRVGYLVKHAAHPKDQLQWLQGLNLQNAQRLYGENYGGGPLRFVHPERDEWVKTDCFRYGFFDTVYKVADTEPSFYFPGYSTVRALLEPLSEKVHLCIDHLPHLEERSTYDTLLWSIASCAAKMLHSEIQSQVVFQSTDAILLCITKYFKKYVSNNDDANSVVPKIVALLGDFPLFFNKEKTLSPNPQHFELALNNGSRSVFYFVKNIFEEKKTPGPYFTRTFQVIA